MPVSGYPLNQVRVEHSDATSALLSARGEFDIANAGTLTRAVQQQFRRGPREIELDVSAVTFIDVVGVEAILAVAQQLQAIGGSLRLIRPSRVVTRLLRVAGLEATLTAARTMRGALAV